MPMPEYILINDDATKVESYHNNYYAAKAEQEKADQYGEKLYIYKLTEG